MASMVTDILYSVMMQFQAEHKNKEELIKREIEVRAFYTKQAM